MGFDDSTSDGVVASIIAVVGAGGGEGTCTGAGADADTGVGAGVGVGAGADVGPGPRLGPGTETTGARTYTSSSKAVGGYLSACTRRNRVPSGGST